ncbi:MAG TPA: rhombosortase [Rheinheimera sp.]|uniref:rhombosortase n=1 Tax=Rheinheimera sp. TaxID=1869214 RepID=UPI002F921E28
MSCLPYLVLAATMLLLAVLPEHTQTMLSYSREGIAAAEYWRLLTGHLVHSNNWHLLMNLGGLLLAMLLHAGCFSSRQLALYWLLCALAISMLLYVGSEQIHIYVGLSGLLHAMLTLGALKDIQLKINTGWLLLVGLIVKVSWEQWHGPDEDLAKLINASVATDAHLYGVVSALALGLPAMLWLKTKKVPRR